MTIETETCLSHPHEGEAECSSKENPFPRASEASSPTSNGKASEENLNVRPAKASKKKRKRKKRLTVSRRNVKKLPVSSVATPNDSNQPIEFEKIINATINANTSKCDGGKHVVEKSSRCDVIKMGNDLKKPKKGKRSSDGVKEETASRKSMRLQLRETSISELFGSRERPRFVEQLTHIDFSDERMKILFMDALGMCPKTPAEKINDPIQHSMEQLESQSLLELSIEDNTIIEQPNHDQVRKSGTEESRDTRSIETHADKSHQSLKDIVQVDLDNMICNKDMVQISPDKIRDEESITIDYDENDNEGWQCWMTRIFTVYPEQEAKSATKEEIDESLTLLSRLGTQVTVV